jgi:hypothetical protein
MQISVHAGDRNKGCPQDSRLSKISKPDKQDGSADEKPDHRIADCTANDLQPTRRTLRNDGVWPESRAPFDNLCSIESVLIAPQVLKTFDRRAPIQFFFPSLGLKGLSKYISLS